MLITITAALLGAIAVAALTLISAGIQVEDHRASIRDRPTSSRLLRAVRRVAGLHVRGFDETADLRGEPPTEKEEAKI